MEHMNLRRELASPRPSYDATRHCRAEGDVARVRCDKPQPLSAACVRVPLGSLARQGVRGRAGDRRLEREHRTSLVPVAWVRQLALLVETGLACSRVPSASSYSGASQSHLQMYLMHVFPPPLLTWQIHNGSITFLHLAFSPVIRILHKNGFEPIRQKTRFFPSKKPESA